MKYWSDEKQNGIDINLNEIGSKKKQLLEAFQACREGRCTCPTEEYLEPE